MTDNHFTSSPGPHYFRPIFPSLTVLRITQRSELEQVAHDMRIAPELFPQLAQYGHRPAVKVLDKEIVVKNGATDHSGNWDAIILNFGDYLVQSENGQRFITDQPHIRHGVLTGLPPSMFYPIEAQRIANEDITL